MICLKLNYQRLSCFVLACLFTLLSGCATTSPKNSELIIPDVQSFTPTYVNQWDALRMQWNKELGKLDASQIPNLEKQMQGGDERAVYLLLGWVSLFQYDKQANIDKTRLIAQVMKLAEQGNPIFMVLLGDIYSGKYRFSLKDVLENNEKKALALYRKAERVGDGMAMSRLGSFYWDGHGGLAKNKKQALDWYLKAANIGNGDAMNSLGYMISGDRRAKISMRNDLSLAWHRKAVAFGNAQSMLSIALFTPDALETLSMIKANADTGNVAMMYQLGVVYETGHYDDMFLSRKEQRYDQFIDKKQAVNWYLKAQTFGYLRGDRLCGMYERGEGGLPKSPSDAARCYLNAYKANLVEESQMEPESKDLFMESPHQKENLERLLATGTITDQALISEISAIAKPAPKLAWLTQDNWKIQEETTLMVKATDSGGGIGKFKLFIDGALVEAKTRDTPVEAPPVQPPQGNTETTVTFAIDKLPPGKHDIKIWAYSIDNVINYAELSTTITTDNPVITKPRLFALVLGVNEYGGDKYNLPNAKKDAEDIAKTLNQQEGKLYESVHVVTLHGKADTGRERIFSALKSFSAGENRPRFNDVFVLYMASHGKAYDEVFHLYTSDVQQNAEENLKGRTITQYELRDLLEAIPTSKKLVLIDACFSGQRLSADDIMTRGIVDEQDVVDSLNRSKGAVVLMASQSDKQALDDYKGHGLFTYVILQGLNGQAANDKGVVTSDSLVDLAKVQVNKISEEVFHRQQHPFPSRAGDGFPVAAGVPKCQGECLY
jgi:TPR repeat protein